MSGSSCSRRATVWSACRLTVMAISPRHSVAFTKPLGNAFWIRSASRCIRASGLASDRFRLLDEDPFLHDPFLQLEDAVEQGFRRRGTTRNVDIYRDKPVHALNDAVTVIDI